MYSTVREVNAFAIANSEYEFLDCDALGIDCDLNGAITAGATTLNFDGLLPAEETIRKNDLIQIDDEYFLVTAVSGSTLTVVPGYGGTVEAPHADNAKIYVKNHTKGKLISRVSRDFVTLHKQRFAPGTPLWLEEDEEMREQAAVQVVYASRYIEEVEVSERIATITNSDFNDGVLSVKYPSGRKFAPGVLEAITNIARRAGVQVGGVLRG